MQLPRTPSFRLDGKRALVTGGTRGIGLGAAVALAEAGAAVTVLARTASDIAELAASAAQAGLRIDGHAVDVTDRERVRSLLGADAVFDILVNSAGLARHAAVGEITEPDYEAVMAVNVKAALFLSQEIAARLIAAGRSGSIIGVSSQMGHVSGPKRAVYSASKFALEGLTRGLAIELGPHNIRVNTICPTFIATELSAKSLADASFRSWVLSKIKLGRLGRIEDIMGPVVFLASDAAALVTGASLMVDGGWTAE